MQRLLISDLDGTLNSSAWRVPLVNEKKWDEFHAKHIYDQVIPFTLSLLQAWVANQMGPIVYMTGRNERFRNSTLTWMQQHNVPEGPLFMRADEDFRKDEIAKGELLERVYRDFESHRIGLILEDRDHIVGLWRSRGLPCLQIHDPGLQPYPFKEAP